MSRSRQRARLQGGLKLDLNRLVQLGSITPGAETGPRDITWRDVYGRSIASGRVSADMTGCIDGWLRIEIGGDRQSFGLNAQPRRFGGRQWYFICGDTNRRASVLWKPPGANRFASRHAWGRQVAYASQFQSPENRTYYQQTKINSRLCSLGGFDPAEWQFPPKPKWMRWRAYNRSMEKFDSYADKRWS